MNQEPKVSIIIPAFNADEYIEECLNSVLAQSYTNLQVIIVDDGSTDNTPQKCDSFAQKDSRVNVIHISNGGQARARNQGLNLVEGDYVFYMDSDDIINTDCIKRLVKIAIDNSIDVVNCSLLKFIGVAPEVSLNDVPHCDIYTTADALKTLLYQRVFNQNPSCKLLSTEIAIKNPFPEGYIYEDMATVYKWFDSTDRIAFVDEVLYLYRQHDGSVMRKSFSERKFDRVKVTSDMMAYIDSKYPELYNAMSARWLLSNLQVLMELPWDIKYKTRKIEIMKNIKSTRKIVINDKQAKKSLRIMALTTYLGVNFTMLEGKLYNRIVNRLS